tara:strand:- start:244 stop:576 length:333 start_codon:yes stop_codon:yes gene_type:complete
MSKIIDIKLYHVKNKINLLKVVSSTLKEKGTVHCLKHIEVLIEKLLIDKDKLKKKQDSKESIKRLNSIGCSTAIISNTRASEYQEPINKLAYRVVDKAKFLRRKGFINER